MHKQSFDITYFICFCQDRVSRSTQPLIFLLPARLLVTTRLSTLPDSAQGHQATVVFWSISSVLLHHLHLLLQWQRSLQSQLVASPHHHQVHLPHQACRRHLPHHRESQQSNHQSGQQGDQSHSDRRRHR